MVSCSIAALRRRLRAASGVEPALLLVYFLSALALSLPMTAVFLLLTSELRAGPAQVSAFYGTTFIPWCLKVTYGLVSDAVPIGGLKRRPYVTAFCVLGTAAYAALALLPGLSLAVATVVAVCAQVYLAGAEVVIDAIVVERVKAHRSTSGGGLTGGDIQAATMLARDCGSLLASSTSLALFAVDAPPRLLIGLAACAPPLVAIAIRFVHEPRVGAARPRGAGPSGSSATDAGLHRDNRDEGGGGVDMRAYGTEREAEAKEDDATDTGSGADEGTSHHHHHHVVHDFDQEAAVALLSSPAGAAKAGADAGDGATFAYEPPGGLYCWAAANIVRVALRTARAVVMGTRVVSRARDTDRSGEDRIGADAGSDGSDDGDDDGEYRHSGARRADGARSALWPPLLFVFAVKSLPTAADAVDTFLVESVKIHNWQTTLLSLAAAVGAILGAAAYRRWLTRVSLFRVFMLTQVVAGAANATRIVIATGAYASLGLPAWLFAALDTLITTACSSAAYLPVVVLAARICPPGMEASLFAVFMSAADVASLFADYLAAALTTAIGVTQSSWDNLWVLCLVCAVIKPLPVLAAAPWRHRVFRVGGSTSQ